MNLNDYQKRAMGTCMNSSDNFSYMMLNLVGEVGELASKVAKQIRKGNCHITVNELMSKGGRFYRFNNDTLGKDMNIELMKEAGDILWQLAGLCTVMGWELEDVAKMNLDKLQARKEAGTIDGNGDGIIRNK